MPAEPGPLGKQPSLPTQELGWQLFSGSFWRRLHVVEWKEHV